MYSMTPISLNEATTRFPVLSAGAHAEMSDRYTHVPTERVLSGLVDEGFQVHGITTARSRNPARAHANKHLIRLRKPGVGGEGEAPEICVLNSHDGSSSYQVFMGMIKFICANGLIVGSVLGGKISIRHQGDIVGDVIDATYSIVEDFPRLVDGVQRMRSVNLDDAEIKEFTKKALAIRYDDPETIMTPDRLARPRRSGDADSTLWNVFNRVQENCIKGSQCQLIRMDGDEVIRAKVREVKSVDEIVRINRALWDLADETLRMKVAA